MRGWDILAYAGAILALTFSFYVLYLYFREALSRLKEIGKEEKKND